MTAPSEFKKHRGSGKRFHVREYNGGKYQVYGAGLWHICECTVRSNAQMIADCLEAIADIEDSILDPK